jgi:hypothetical protein
VLVDVVEVDELAEGVVDPVAVLVLVVVVVVVVVELLLVVVGVLVETVVPLEFAFVPPKTPNPQSKPKVNKARPNKPTKAHIHLGHLSSTGLAGGAA